MSDEIRQPSNNDSGDDDSDAGRDPQSSSRVRAYLELFRLPNVFTAMADVLMGFLIARGTFHPGKLLAALLGSSSLLYLAGMVLNDFFDRQADAIDRPDRPIPSGRVTPNAAATMGFGMLAGGTLLGLYASWLTGDIRAGAIAALLAVAVLLYDAVLRRTVLGPLAMGACRSLNVLLGMSVIPIAFQPVHWVIAGAIGLYIVGVTWLARTEASRSSRPQLVAAAVVMLAGVALLSQYPVWTRGTDLRIDMPQNWNLAWIFLGLLIGWRAVRAIVDPRPEVVQTAVKNSIHSLIVLDAAASLPFADGSSAIVIVLLLFPATLLGRRIHST